MLDKNKKNEKIPLDIANIAFEKSHEASYYLKGIYYGVVFGVVGNLFVSHLYGLLEFLFATDMLVMNLIFMITWGFILYSIVKRFEMELEIERKWRVSVIKKALSLAEE